MTNEILKNKRKIIYFYDSYWEVNTQSGVSQEITWTEISYQNGAARKY